MADFKYQPRPQEAWDKRAKGSIFEGYAKDEYSTFTPKKENAIRILPPTWENPNHYGYDLWLHWSVGPNNATVVCLSKMKNMKCPVCEAFARAETNGREDAKELKPTRRVLVWLIDRKEEQEKSGNVKPLLYALPWTVDRDISKVCRDRGTGALFQIDHPDSGRDVYFDKEQKGGSTQNVEYTGFQIATRETAVDKKHLDYVVAHPLPTTLQMRSYEEVQAFLEGGIPTPPAAVSEQAAPESTAVHTPPPPPPAQTPGPPPPPPVAVFPPEGWMAHPDAAGYYYKGQEVKSEADLRASMAPPPPTNGHADVLPPVPKAGAKSGGGAAALKARFETGAK